MPGTKRYGTKIECSAINFEKNVRLYTNGRGIKNGRYRIESN